MSGALQTTTAVFAVVQVSIAAAKLIKKIAHAQDEANVWISDLNRLTQLWELVAQSMMRREQGRSVSTQEEGTISLIKSSMKACEGYIATMKVKLEPLAESEVVYFQMSQVPKRIRFLYDKAYIESQEKEIGKHIASLQLCFDLLHRIDLAAIIAAQQSQETRLTTLQRILSSDVPAAEHDQASNQFIDTYSESNDNLSEHIAWSNMARLEDGAIASSPSDEIPTTSPTVSTAFTDYTGSHTADSIADSVLVEAVKANDSNRLRELLDGSDDQSILSVTTSSVQTTDTDDWTVLHYAAHEGHSVIMRILLEYCERNTLSLVNAKSSEEHTPLMEAAKKANLPFAADIAKDLLARGADIDAVDGEKRCALHFAMCKKWTRERERFVETLLNHRPSPNLGLVIETFGKQDTKKKWPKVWQMYELVGLRRTESLDSGIGMESASRNSWISRRLSRNSRNS